jgi:hypothetical protein
LLNDEITLRGGDAFLLHGRLAISLTRRQAHRLPISTHLTAIDGVRTASS